MLIKKIGEVPVRYLIDKTYRITVYSTSLVRIEYSKKGVFDDEEPLILEPALAMKEKNLSFDTFLPIDIGVYVNF